MRISPGIVGSSLLLLAIAAAIGVIVAITRMLGGQGNWLAAPISGISVLILFFVFIIIGPEYFVLLIGRMFDATAHRRNKR